MTRTRTKAACHESAARDMMEREWGEALFDARRYARENAAAIDAEWEAADGRTALQATRDYLAALSPEERARLNAEWEN